MIVMEYPCKHTKDHTLAISSGHVMEATLHPSQASWIGLIEMKKLIRRSDFVVSVAHDVHAALHVLMICMTIQSREVH